MLDLSSTHRKKVVGRNKINYDLCVSRLKTIIHSDPASTKTRNNERKPPKRNHRNHRNETTETTETTETSETAETSETKPRKQAKPWKLQKQNEE